MTATIPTPAAWTDADHAIEHAARNAGFLRQPETSEGVIFTKRVPLPEPIPSDDEGVADAVAVEVQITWSEDDHNPWCLLAFPVRQDGALDDEPWLDSSRTGLSDAGIVADAVRAVRAFAGAYTHEDEVLLAGEFTRRLYADLGAVTMGKVVRWNAAYAAAGDLASCATHEFCDANVVMDEAGQALGLWCDATAMTSAVTCLWNAAWAFAKTYRFGKEG